MPTERDLIAEARALCAKATPGPWRMSKSGLIVDGNGTALFAGSGGRDNAELVAYSRTIIPELCDALESAQPQWISVKDGLPKYDYHDGAKAYWVAYDTHHGKEMRLALYCDYMYATVTALPECVTWRDWESNKINNVTHWMPLPALPKEDADA